MHAVRRRHGYFRHRFCDSFQKPECRDHRTRPPANFSGNAKLREALGDAVFIPPLQARGAGAVGLEALPAEDQLEPPAAPAELAVGDRLQADSLLHGDALADAAVLDRTQSGVVVRPQVALRGLRAEELLA